MKAKGIILSWNPPILHTIDAIELDSSRPVTVDLGSGVRAIGNCKMCQRSDCGICSMVKGRGCGLFRKAIIKKAYTPRLLARENGKVKHNGLTVLSGANA